MRRQGRRAGGGAAAAAAESSPQGYLGPWFERGIAANITAAQLELHEEATGARRFPMARAGSVRGIAINFEDDSGGTTAARTAGTASFEVYINGVATGLAAVLDATDTKTAVATQAADLDTFVAGDLIDVRYTTDAAWTPTTAGFIVVASVLVDETAI